MSRKTYIKDMEIAKEKSRNSIDKINKLFPENNFLCLVEEFGKYDENVQKHYKKHLKTNDVWNRIKIQIQEGVRP